MAIRGANKDAMDYFLFVNNALEKIKQPISSLPEGALVRYFNEGISHRDIKAHADLQKEIGFQAKNDNFLKNFIQNNLPFQGITSKFVADAEILFAELDKDLTDDPKWNDFWKKLNPQP